jgi:hypothetical protein
MKPLRHGEEIDLVEIARPHLLTRVAGTAGTTPWTERENADA